MSEDIKTQFKTEGDPAFPVENKENDNSADSSSEKTDIEQTPPSGEDKNTDANTKIADAGLADHPRWKEREADWSKRFNDQEERHVSELAKLREDVDKQIKGLSPRTENAVAPIPSWFNGDENQWREFNEWNKSLYSKAKEEARTEALGEIDNRTRTEQKAIDDATNYFKSEVSKLEIDTELNPKGEKIDQNKLLKFVLDNDLVDSKGRWNYRAAYRMMKNQPEQKNNTDRKNLAGATTSDKHTETKPKPFATSEDFQKPGGRPW